MGENKEVNPKRVIPVIFFTIFLDMLGYGILIPVIPLLLADPASEFYMLSSTVSVSTGYLLLGLLLAIFPFFQFFAAPILGQLSDRYGRKRVILISIIGTCLSYILFAFGILTKNLPLLFFSRGLDGLTGGSIAAAHASIADITTTKNRTKTFGLIGGAFGLGFIFGPFIGGKLSDPSVISWFDAATPFWFAAILSLINIMFIYLVLVETLKAENRLTGLDWNRSLKNIINAFKYKDLRIPFLTVFLFSAGFTFFTTFFGVFLIKQFGFNQSQIGNFFAYVGLWIVLTQILLIRIVVKYFRNSTIIKFGLFGTSVAILLYFLPTAWWWLLLIAPLFAFFNGITSISTTALVSLSAEEKIQGEILGINSSIQAFAQVIPPIIAGIIAASIAWYMPILASSTTILIAAVLFTILYKHCKVCQKDLDG